MNCNNNKKKNDVDEVNQLLQAAQDELLLKLSINPQISHLSSNSLHSDLDRRFQALKSLPQAHSQPHTRVNVGEDDLESVLGNDLSARFAALKASSSVSSSYNNNTESRVGPRLSENDDDEDEVEKIIRWAKDAARLDPSLPSDDHHSQ